MDLLIDFGVPVITALLAYFTATKQHSVKLKETKLILEQEIEAIEKSHEVKIKELEKELELQQKSKESDVVLDFAKGVMGKVLEDPSELQKIQKLSEEINNFQKKDTE